MPDPSVEYPIAVLNSRSAAERFPCDAYNSAIMACARGSWVDCDGSFKFAFDVNKIARFAGKICPRQVISEVIASWYLAQVLLDLLDVLITPDGIGQY